jgi:hypothetical protein
VRIFLGVKRCLREWRLVGGIVLIGALASGCAAGGFNAKTLHDRLVEAGLRPAQATCVLDKMTDKFDEQLNTRTDPIAAELRAQRELLRQCGVASAPR